MLVFWGEQREVAQRWGDLISLCNLWGIVGIRGTGNLHHLMLQIGAKDASHGDKPGKQANKKNIKQHSVFSVK